MICFPTAKINIGLHIKNRRSDGYHEIESLLYPILWEDALEFVEARKTQLFCSGLPVERERNLVLEVYALLQKKYPLRPVKIYLHKQIPCGAGLGGGSSNAAQMLNMIVKYFKLPLSREEIYSYALQLGSDVPFFIDHRPTWVSGRGEKLKPAPNFLKGMWIVVGVPKHLSISTQKTYKELRILSRARPNLEKIIDIPRKNWIKEIRNEFQIPLFSKHVELRRIDTLLEKLGAWYRSLSGTGSAVYGLFEASPETLPSKKPLAKLFKELNCYYWTGQLT